MSRRSVLFLIIIAAVLGAVLWRYATPRTTLVLGGWGIDACLTTHTYSEARADYTELLGASGVGWLRERQPKPSIQSLHRAGYRVVAFAHFNDLKPRHAGNQLPEDLCEVFIAARITQKNASGIVDAWEMVGEPDIGYCTDLPDRVAAYQKALYLGIKAGAREAGWLKTDGGWRTADGGKQIADVGRQMSDGSEQQAPLVLMGALGMPPGPWLERAAANGLLDYTDAYNFHYYGHAQYLTGVIEAHREAIRQLSGRSYSLAGKEPDNAQPITNTRRHAAMPLWITEAGLEAVDKKDFFNPQRRQLQAEFTVSTAKQALAAPDVAMFMPFILVHDKDPYAMTVSPTHTFPAWDVYAKFTRENPWPNRPLSRGAREMNPVVVQWLPDNKTTVPKKTSGTYRFRGDRPIVGELRIYNFGELVARGSLASRLSDGSYGLLGGGKNFRITSNGQPITEFSELVIEPMSMKAVPVEFRPQTDKYFRETWSAAFVESDDGGRMADVGERTADGRRQRAEGGRRTSVVSFGLEAWPQLEDFVEEPLALRPLPNGKIRFPQTEPYAAGETVGVWTTMNGVRVSAGGSSGLLDRGFLLSGTTNSSQPITSNDGAATFWIETVNTDPLAPELAVAGIEGLTAAGGRQTAGPATFLRLQMDKPMTKDRRVLVVLVDDRGQRYSIWENMGVDYYGSRSDVWLSLEDFHADSWGPVSADYQLRPERIREVHLRLYLETPGDKVGVRLSLLHAKR